MRKQFSLSVLALLLAFGLSACSGTLVKKEALNEMKKVGLLTVVVEKCGPNIANNTGVIQNVANYSVDQIETKLGQIGSFQIVPSAAYIKNADYKNAGILAKNAGVQAYLKHKADTDRNFVLSANISNAKDSLSALGAMFSTTVTDEQKQKAIRNATNMGQKMLDKSKEKLTTPKGMPFIPYGIFNDRNPNKVSIKAGDAKEDENRFKDMMLQGVGDLCTKLNLDGMIVVHASTEVPPIGSIRVVSGRNRVLGKAKLNMTMLIINPKGEVVADLHWPNMDSLAPSKGYIPTHVITSRKGKHITGTAMDLKDPKGAVLKAFQELVVDSAGKMTTAFRKAAGEIK
jgi:hypothetical protein